MIATITNPGKARGMVIDEAFNADQLIEVLKALIKDAGKKVFLIELNPEKRLNADLKQAIGRKVPVRTKAKLWEAANEHMIQLAQSPDRIKCFFQDQPGKYAA